jgi:hypothetical protein
MSIPVGATVTITTIAAQEPKAPVSNIAAAEAELRSQPTKSASRSTTKPKASPKPKASAPKVNSVELYAEVQALTKSGRYDEARQLAATKPNWQHVIDGVDRYEAKHGDQPKAENVESTPKPTKSAATKAAPTKSVTKKAAPKPTKSARPKCPIHDRFLSNQGDCYTCSPEQNIWAKQPKAAEAPAPTKSAPKGRAARQQPKAAPAKAAAKPLTAAKQVAAGQVTKAATSKAKPSKALAKKAAPAKPVSKAADGAKLGTGLTASLTESDLALYWAQLAVLGHGDVLEAALSTCREQLAAHRNDGNKLMSGIYAKRITSLENAVMNVKKAA